MATRFEWSKLGLKILCETSARPLPRVAQAYPLPDFGSAASPLISVTQELVPATDKYGVRVVSLSPLGLPTVPGLWGYWSLRWIGYIGSPTGSEVANTRTLPTNDPISLLIEDVVAGMTYEFHLEYISQMASQPLVYPSVTVFIATMLFQGAVSHIPAGNEFSYFNLDAPGATTSFAGNDYSAAEFLSTFGFPARAARA